MRLVLWASFDTFFTTSVGIFYISGKTAYTIWISNGFIGVICSAQSAHDSKERQLISEHHGCKIQLKNKHHLVFVLELTARSFSCRMVVAGYNMIRGMFADSANVFRYDAAYGLNQKQVQFLIPSAWDNAILRLCFLNGNLFGIHRLLGRGGCLIYLEWSITRLDGRYL